MKFRLVEELAFEQNEKQTQAFNDELNEGEPNVFEQPDLTFDFPSEEFDDDFEKRLSAIDAKYKERREKDKEEIEKNTKILSDVPKSTFPDPFA